MSVDKITETFDWSEYIPSLVKVPWTIYKNRVILQHWLIKILVQLNKGDTDIAILGRPSVGKTILSKCLHGQAPKFSFKEPATSTNVESEAITLGEWTKVVRVIPGQSDLKQRLQGLDEVFNKSQTLEGLIYVVDWGYSEPRDQQLKRSLIEDFRIDTIQKIRDYNLKEELADISRVVEK